MTWLYADCVGVISEANRRRFQLSSDRHGNSQKALGGFCCISVGYYRLRYRATSRAPCPIFILECALAHIILAAGAYIRSSAQLHSFGPHAASQYCDQLLLRHVLDSHHQQFRRNQINSKCGRLTFLCCSTSLCVLFYGIAVHFQVFKKTSRSHLFALVTSDAIERFYLFCDGLIVLLRFTSSVRMPLASYVNVFLWLVGCSRKKKIEASMVLLELMVDWFKHCFVLKLNFIETSLFNGFRQVRHTNCFFAGASKFGLP
eukprot:284815775_4